MGKKSIENVKETIEEYLSTNGPKYAREICSYLTVNDKIGTHMGMNGVRIGKMLSGDSRFKGISRNRNFVLWDVSNHG